MQITGNDQSTLIERLGHINAIEQHIIDTYAGKQLS